MKRVTEGQVADRVPKAAELIADQIRGWIIRGELQADEPLKSEYELLTQFGVSRPTMREAFRILEAESLIYVVRGAHGGPRVSAPTTTAATRSVGTLLQFEGTTLMDVWEAGLVIEPPLARRLALNRTRADLVTLNDSIEEHNANLNDPPAFRQTAARFHDLVVSLAGNRTLGLLSGILDEIFKLHTVDLVSRQRPGVDLITLNRITLREHARLVEHVKNRDGARAESAWRRHLDAVGKVILEEEGNTTVVDLCG
jgi:GntR family transcriptional repressor for pyruvate dehydrogenase complex